MYVMKKTYLVFVLFAILSLNFCGCAMSQKNAGSSDISDSSALGDGKNQALKSEAKQEEGMPSEQITRPFVTKNCIYEVDEVGGEYVIQTDLQGKHKKHYEVPGGFWETDGESIQISDEHICYKKEGKLFVSPIRQTDEGEEIVWKEKEKIAGDVEVVCISEPYLIYVGNTVYRYDFRTKESKPLGNKGEFDYAYFYNNYWLMPVIYNGKMYFYDDIVEEENDKDTIYRLDIEEWEAEKLPIERKNLAFSELAGIRDSLMCVAMRDSGMRDSGDDTDSDKEESFLVCLDTETDRKTVLTEQELFNLLDKEKLWEKEDGECHIWRLEEAFQYGGRTYLVLDLLWTQKRKVDFGPDKGKKTQVWPHRTVLLSCPLDNINELSYEREISEWLYSRAGRVLELDEEGDYEEYVQAGIYTLYHGELYMNYNDDEGSHMVAYSMQTGEYREVTKEETAYYLFADISFLE